MSDQTLVRLGNRSTTEFRDLEVQLGVLNDSDGSCELKFLKNQLIIGIFGPVEVQSKDEVLGQAYLQINFKHPSTIPGPDTKFIENQLSKIFSDSLMLTYQPRSMVQININSINLDGDLLSSCITCTSLATMDCNLPSTKLVLSLCCAIVNSNLILDPTSEELKDSSSIHVLAFSNLNLEPKLEYQLSTGTYTFSEFESVYDLILDGCKRLHQNLPNLF